MIESKTEETEKQLSQPALNTVEKQKENNLQIIVEEKLEEMIKEGTQLLKAGQALLQNVQTLIESKKDVKSVTDMITENLPNIGKNKK